MKGVGTTGVAGKLELEIADVLKKLKFVWVPDEMNGNGAGVPPGTV